MQWYHFLIIFVAVLFLLLLGLTIYCFNRVFYSKNRKPLKNDDLNFLSGEGFDKFGAELKSWAKKSKELPHEDFEITSFDGLTLRGKYFEKQKGKPIEIIFNGYRGDVEKDMSIAIERCFALNRNCLLVNQRATGISDGNVITFGVNESKDCKKWVDFIVEKFGEDVEIILTGISLGGATVVMATTRNLPKNVKYVLSDCPYSSAKEMIMLTVKRMGLPPKLIYPIIKLSARVFGRFNLEENPPILAVKKSTIPIIFFHGKADGFIPYQMSQTLLENCNSDKRLVLIENADHGLCYLEDKDKYISSLIDFDKRHLNNF